MTTEEIYQLKENLELLVQEIDPRTGFKFVPVFIIKQEKAFAGKLFADNENARSLF